MGQPDTCWKTVICSIVFNADLPYGVGFFNAVEFTGKYRVTSAQFSSKITELEEWEHAKVFFAIYHFINGYRIIS
ncbi:hypothetical protein GCM10009001_14930 [Virgibacillus siamensis]|uniref:Ferritin-like domain-containing protein n=1 Tax=Virgibacillus siamensis TaxID=480071 RepID=A0ABN1FX58_9BACI